MQHIFIQDFGKSLIISQGFGQIISQCGIYLIGIQVFVLRGKLGNINPILSSCISQKFL